MCSAWVLCGKEAEATTAPAICKQPARATTSATTVCSLRCPTIARSAPTMAQKNPRRWTLKMYWNRKRQNHFLATRLVVVGGGSCRESMQGGEGGRSGTRRERIRCREEESRAAGSKSADVLLVRLSDNFGQKDQFWALAPSDIRIRARMLSSGFFHRIPNISVLFKWLLILSKELCLDIAW